MQAFLSQRVVMPDGIRPSAILVDEGRIHEIVEAENIPIGIEINNFGSSAILPGLVDSHVHINDPGRAEWEGFATATRAAAAGGYTTLIDMPLNCLPAATSATALEKKRDAARGRCWVDWAAWGGVVHDNQNDIVPLARAGARGFKCFLVHPGIDGFTMVTPEQLASALPHVAKTDLPLLVHAELPEPIDAATEKLETKDWRQYATYLHSRPDEAELSAIRLLISLCRQYKFRLHIVHLATSVALDALCAARAEGLQVTVETCPHYLHFSAEDIRDGSTLHKCAPPIRSRENRERLWDGFRNGAIDLIATDHSPCPPEMKRLAEGNFKTAWGGIPGLSLALAVVWTEAKRRGFSLSDIARWMAEAPARLAGCSKFKGRIAPGFDADFAVFDSEREFKVTTELLHYRHAISPYLGEKLRGVVQATYLRGALIFNEGRFIGQPAGQELPR